MKEHTRSLLGQSQRHPTRRKSKRCAHLATLEPRPAPLPFVGVKQGGPPAPEAIVLGVLVLGFSKKTHLRFHCDSKKSIRFCRKKLVSCRSPGTWARPGLAQFTGGCGWDGGLSDSRRKDRRSGKPRAWRARKGTGRDPWVGGRRAASI